LACVCDAAAEKKAVSFGSTGDPKREAGSLKADVTNLSIAALLAEGEVMRQGAEKYGSYNWTVHSMRASTYYNAILRHLWAWWTGQDTDPDSGQSHLAHIRASCGILIEQQVAARLNDDRPREIARAVPIMARLKRLLP
jgi:hypothetical protein